MRPDGPGSAGRLGLHKAGLELVLAHEGAERDAYVQEPKDVLIRSPEPLVGDRLRSAEDSGAGAAGARRWGYPPPGRKHPHRRPRGGAVPLIHTP
ncbi:hypothetical protein QF030_003314 [Streptomyces rishiriensis]|uniref:Uncharacterized protein n=1 Tax=Streptomyces rishiriensis TaxID=68264 RepID=A0ABU0NPQ2_STRRH|nr:hypothetical protein [Streptomyces rishiriensis]